MNTSETMLQLLDLWCLRKYKPPRIMGISDGILKRITKGNQEWKKKNVLVQLKKKKSFLIKNVNQMQPEMTDN